jgi:hypothetical protein
MKSNQQLFAPERSGDSLKGGGHPADVRVKAKDEIDEMTDHLVGGHGKSPGLAEESSEDLVEENGLKSKKSSSYSGSTPP